MLWNSEISKKLWGKEQLEGEGRGNGVTFANEPCVRFPLGRPTATLTVPTVSRGEGGNRRVGRKESGEGIEKRRKWWRGQSKVERKEEEAER